MPAPPTPNASPAATTMRFGSPGSRTTSVMQRLLLLPTPLNLAKTGEAEVAFVQRKIPRGGRPAGILPLMPPTPNVVATKMLSGFVGSTAILPTDVPLNTSALEAFLLK